MVVEFTFSRHLPDITIITPVFGPNGKEIIFFTASRGHHADIGGILPGSMPPTSVNLFQEGAEIVSFKIVNGGVFDRNGLLEYMIDKPSQYPGCSGCRNIRDVESDLKAVSERAPRVAFLLTLLIQQIAANNKGTQLIHASMTSTLSPFQYFFSSCTQLLRTAASRLFKNTCITFELTQRCPCVIFSATLRNVRDQTSCPLWITSTMDRRLVYHIVFECVNMNVD